MRKVVYLEGVTELVFVYNLICTHYEYSGEKVYINSINLDNNFKFEIPSHFGLTTAPDNYLLVCAGGDTGVISKMRDRYQGHIDAGYDIVVGLKDVFGEAYTQLAGHKMDVKSVERLITIQRGMLPVAAERVSLCFAIMEVEAWILGMSWFLKREYPNISLPSEIDPETAFLHPYDVIHKAFNQVGVLFEKHWSDVLAVFNRIKKEDFDKLYKCNICSSFNFFFDILFGPCG